MDIEKAHGKGCGVFMSKDYGGPKGHAVHNSTAKSQDELTAEAFAKPASADCIMAHLTRMSAILHLKGTSSKDDDDGLEAAFLLSDFTTRLVDAKVREVDLFLSCEYFIERNEDGFFPTIAKLMKHLGIKTG